MKQEFLRAKVVRVLEPYQKGDFKKRSIILNIEPENHEHPNEVEVEFIKDKADLLASVKKGDTVNVDCFINGRSWLKEGEPETKRRWFNGFRGWKIVPASSSVNVAPPENDIFVVDDDPGDNLPY